MTVFGCNGDADDIRRSTDRSCAATDVSTKGKCPCKDGQICTGSYSKAFDDRDHRSRKWNIINDRACYSGDPDNNNYDKCDISTTDRMNKGCDQFENTGFFQTANDYK